MGFFDKLRKGAKEKAITAAFNKVLADEPLSYFAVTNGTSIGKGTCDVCGERFNWVETIQWFPIPVRLAPDKPDRSTLDLGGWCKKCQRVLCPSEADYVRFTMKNEDWWIPGCRDCQLALLGYRSRPDLDVSSRTRQEEIADKIVRDMQRYRSSS